MTEGQTIQRPKDKGRKDRQYNGQKTKDRRTTIQRPTDKGRKDKQ